MRVICVFVVSLLLSSPSPPDLLSPPFHHPSYSSSSFTQILTKDAVTVSVEAVIYYRISDASAVVNQLENYRCQN